MTSPAERRLEPVQVLGAYAKGAEWELNIQLSFLKKATKAWVKKETDVAPHGTYWCVLVKGDKWSDREGDGDWQYNWDIAEFDVPAPDGQTQTPPEQLFPDDEAAAEPGYVAPPAPDVYSDVMKADHPSTRHSYHMQSAMKAANEFYGGRENCSPENVVLRAVTYLKFFTDHADGWQPEPVKAEAPDGKPW